MLTEVMILRGLIVLLLLFDAFLAYKFIWSNRGYIYYQEQCQYKQSLVNRLDKIETESCKLSQQIRMLKKESRLLEKEIRCRLHYARDDEVMYMKFEE